MGRDRKLPRDERIRRSLRWMERYAELFGGMDRYLEAVEEPPPVDLLVPGGEEDLRLVTRRLGERGYRAKRFDWTPHHLRVSGESGGAGTLAEVIFGLAFPQGVVSSLPCLALDPRPGQRILDICAAPGGKTVLLSRMARNRARILAGDPNAQRAGLLVQSLSRMGIASTMTVQQDGNSFPAVAAFDRILLDAPCTGEGTFRIPKPRYEPTALAGLERARALQSRLLARAASLLAPAGRLVYATCTFAPEENEAVLSDLLAARGDIDVVELPSDFPGENGLSAWNGRRFDPRLVRARRLYPQSTGSWGFFLALLEKDPASGRVNSRRLREGEDPGVPTDQAPARAELESLLAARFGVDADALSAFIVQRQARDIWLLGRLPDATRDIETARLRVIAPGLRAIRATGRGPRVTNAAFRCLGVHVTDRVLDVSWETLLGLLEESRMPAPMTLGAGQVALRCEGRVVAAGYVQGRELRLEIPKAWR